MIKTMKFTPVDTGVSLDSLPGSEKWYVGMDLWLWVKNASDRTVMGPQVKTATAGGVEVTATAKLARIDYAMGDGGHKRCSGPGVPYKKSSGNRPSPSCGYIYSKMSPGQGKGSYTITATSHWEVTWTGGGESGTLPMEVSSSRPLRVGEIQVLNVPSS